MGLPTGPLERGGQLPDRVHRPSDQQESGGGAAPAQHALGRVRQQQHFGKLANRGNLVGEKQ